ncbi:MAG: hypothetical protein ABIN80_26450 [Dyadobacter sp.]
MVQAFCRHCKCGQQSAAGSCGVSKEISPVKHIFFFHFELSLSDFYHKGAGIRIRVAGDLTKGAKELTSLHGSPQYRI